MSEFLKMHTNLKPHTYTDLGVCEAERTSARMKTKKLRKRKRLDIKEVQNMLLYIFMLRKTFSDDFVTFLWKLYGGFFEIFRIMFFRRSIRM
jgi:hypothetical protein